MKRLQLQHLFKTQPEAKPEAVQEPIPLYWWAKKKNFGDLIGPWLVNLMTGRETVNIRGTRDGRTGLATVGSLVHSLDRPGLGIWGSGSIGAISREQAEKLKLRTPSKIYALRGAKTHWEVTRKLGWEAPTIFGDPALLLPKYYKPRPFADARQIAVVPHYMHRSLYKGEDDRIHVVDVRRDADVVIDEIVSAKYCISTSLHGVIVAQAYGVPWLWLRMGQVDLLGGEFKFEDFFTVLERRLVRRAIVDPDRFDAGHMVALSKHCHLPKATVSFDKLEDSFPRDFRA